ncbi:MAG TPA: glutamate formimidoyltransferase [Anaerolineales bacterium]|nr:glutamate formimidoyltransferase [Anaerolineales bacterium]
MQKILMAEPNISEGRRPEIVEEIVDAVRRTAGVTLVDYSSDADHNRSVVTFIGAPDAVLGAAKALAEAAFRLIDMSVHQGAHPRQGAVDVCAFIPIRGMTTGEAVEISRAFGRDIGDLGVPVYYYEEAATRPERAGLPAIRKGEYEALEAKLKDPEWAPDEGPAVFNPRAGALVTGSRFPLIAFNVNLRTHDLDIAKNIARAVRYATGGFHSIRAMGFALEEKGMVQVSMNLVNYSKTPVHRVLETVRSETARYGVQVAGTEIIGPIPLDALQEIVRFYLQAHAFEIEQVVETALLGEQK